MILKIFSGNQIYVYCDIDRTFFRRCSAGGMKYIQFDISINHPIYKYLSEEIRVEYDGDDYVIKGINERSKSKVSTVNCELNLDGLKNCIITETFETESFYNVCNRILRGTGWTIVDSELISKRTTLELVNNTPWEALEKCTNSTCYETCYRYDTKNKIIYSIKPYSNTAARGVFFTDELNLDELSFKGSSTSLITRLYCYGKDGLSIASVNDGKEYIDNFSYTNKVICGVWIDERYTNAGALKNDGTAKLEVLSKPTRSYTLKVINLAKIKPDIYGEVLNYDLYDVVTLIDRNRKSRTDMRIVEVTEYPADHTLDTVTISNVPAKITAKITSLENKVTSLDAQTLYDRKKLNEIKQDLDSTVLHVAESWSDSVNESLFTQTAEGLYLEVDSVVGINRWSTLLQQSANDIRISWNNISDYIKLENAQMNIYPSKNAEKAILSVHRDGMTVYDNSGSILMNLNSTGEHFYYKNNYVGKIGTNCYTEDIKKRGLSFDIENSTAYMAWARQDDGSDDYTIKFGYLSPNISIGQWSGGSEKDVNNVLVGMLHAGCSLDMHEWYIHNAVLKNWQFDGGGFTGTKTFKIPTSIRESDGTVATWQSIQLKYKNGILQSAEGWS